MSFHPFTQISRVLLVAIVTGAAAGNGAADSKAEAAHPAPDPGDNKR